MKPALVRSSIRIAVATVAMVPVGLLTASSASASAATFDGYGPTAYGGYYWSPSSATINSGQSVSWANASGTHGLKTLSGPWPSSCQSAPDPVTCTLTSPGTYNFECYYHLSAMTGSVTVNAPLQPSPAQSQPPPPPPTHSNPATPAPVRAATPTPKQSSAAPAQGGTPAPAATASATPEAVALAPSPSESPGGVALNPGSANSAGRSTGFPALPVGAAVVVAAAGGGAYWWFARRSRV